MSTPVVGHNYRFYTGDIYRVFSLAIMAETGEPAVIFRDQKAGTMLVAEVSYWERPAKQGSKQVERYTLIESSSI